MKISMILTIVGWILFLISVFLRTNYSKRKFSHLTDVRGLAINLNISALLCFLISILISHVLVNLNIVLW